MSIFFYVDKQKILTKTTLVDKNCLLFLLLSKREHAMIPAVLLTTGTSLVTLSIVPYIKDIIRGNAKPRLLSWAIWTLLLGLTALVSWQEHQMSSAALSAASMFGCFIVAVLAARYTNFEFTRLERYSLLGAVLGIGLWLLFDSPMLVLLTAITVDAVAYLPTFANGWHNPHHESMTMFVISAFGSGLVLIAAVLDHASSQGLAYPLYSVIFGSIMVGILLTRRQKATYEE
jgi:hypothetical protein